MGTSPLCRRYSARVEPTDDRDAYLDSVLIGGREPVEIVVVDYDPQWRAHFSDHPAVRDDLDLRDWLRRSPQDRDRYATTKRALARRAWRDMNDYADAKTEVITEIRERARRALRGCGQ